MHVCERVCVSFKKSMILCKIIFRMRAVRVVHIFLFQASDAQNIGMQVALKKCQQQLFSVSNSVLCKDSNRLSLPLEGTRITYKPLKGMSRFFSLTS